MGHSIVQNIMLIAGFAIVCIMAVTWLGTAILNKEVDTAVCIEEASTYSVNHACTGDAHGSDHSFTKDLGYSSRY